MKQINLPGARITLMTDEYGAAIRAEYVKRLRLCAELVKNEVVRRLREHSTKAEGPSEAGEIPHYDTARLSQSIFTAVDEQGLSAKVIAGAAYGFFLEYKMDRSFLRRTLFEMMPRIRQILTAKLPPGKLQVKHG